MKIDRLQVTITPDPYYADMREMRVDVRLGPRFYHYTRPVCHDDFTSHFDAIMDEVKRAVKEACKEEAP